MYKKIGRYIKTIFILVIICIIINNYIIVAYADSAVDYIPDWLSFIADTSQTIIGYDGTDDAYNNYLSNTQQSFKYGAMVQALNSVEIDPYLAELFPLAKPVNATISLTESYLDGKYRAAVVNRDYVDRLYSNVNGFAELSDNYHNLSYYNVTVVSEIDYNNNISLTGTWITLDNSNGYDGYYDITNAKSYSNKVSILYGSGTPPIMYVGSNAVAYQGERMLAKNALYYLYSPTVIYRVGFNTSYSLMSPYLYRRPNAGLTDVRASVLTFKDIIYNAETSKYTGSSGGAYYIKEYTNGVESNDLSVGVDSYNAIQGLETCVGVNIMETQNAYEPPSDIPYDNNNTTIMLMPIDNSNNPTYNNIRYISPTTLINYYNDGNVTTDNYTYNNDSQYINTIINNYDEYINNGSSNNGGNYDDTQIQSKLDIIIGKLNDIISSIRNISNSDDSDIEIFSSTPIYVSFGDCITDNIAISSDIDNIMSDLDVDTEADVINYIDSFKSDSDSDIDNIIYNSFNDVNINTSWYEPYRLRVRNLLKIPCWILGICTAWAIIRSVFGIQISSEGG